MGRHLGGLGDDGHIQIADDITRLLHPGKDIPQQDAAVDPLEFGGRIREVAADVAGPDGPQQGIAHRMQHHVAIGVGQQPLLIGHCHPAQHAGADPAKLVYVKTMTDSHHARCPPIMWKPFPSNVYASRPWPLRIMPAPLRVNRVAPAGAHTVAVKRARPGRDLPAGSP